ncbi:hypothetical protein [Micromonospora sp. NPDC049662]
MDAQLTEKIIQVHAVSKGAYGCQASTPTSLTPVYAKAVNAPPG